MSDLTRRGFLRTASIGAGALGVIGFLPSIARADQQPQLPGMPTGSFAPASMPSPGAQLSATPMVVFITDPSSGKGTVFVGEQAIPFVNPALVQSVQSVRLAA